MRTPRGLSGTISKHKDCGKIGCLTDEADVSSTPDVNTGDTFYNYEIHTFTIFYVRATNDV